MRFSRSGTKPSSSGRPMAARSSAKAIPAQQVAVRARVNNRIFHAFLPVNVPGGRFLGTGLRSVWPDRTGSATVFSALRAPVALLRLAGDRDGEAMAASGPFGPTDHLPAKVRN